MARASGVFHEAAVVSIGSERLVTEEAAAPNGARRQNGGMSIGEDLLEERRRRRKAGDPRITPEGREALLRLTTGDLMDDFQAALDADLADPALGDGDSDAD